MGALAEADHLNRLERDLFGNCPQRVDSHKATKRSEDRGSTQRPGSGATRRRHEVRHKVKRQKQVLLWYSVIAVTINSFMWVGKLRGWWN